MKDYIKEIIKSNLDQGPFKIDKRYFIENNELVNSIKNELPKNLISREYVLSKFKEGINDPDSNGFAKGIVSTLMWGSYIQSVGHGNRAYNKILDLDLNLIGKEVYNLLKEKEGIEKAYISLSKNGENKIKDISEAYFTKFLYFMAKAHNELKTNNSLIMPLPLIYDKWANNFYYALLLSEIPGKTERIGQINIEYTIRNSNLKKLEVIPKYKENFSIYLNYINDMNGWAEYFKIKADKLEELLFGVPVKSGNMNYNARYFVMKYIYDKINN
jgi:hypothetical protein